MSKVRGRFDTFSGRVVDPDGTMTVEADVVGDTTTITLGVEATLG